MKKLFALLLALVMMLSLASCDNNDAAPDIGEDTKQGEVKDTKGEDTPDTPETEKGLTIEDVLNHPVSPLEDFKFGEREEGFVLMEYYGDDEIVVLPDSINGKPIIRIADTVFYQNQTIKAIKMPTTVIRIDGGAFKECENLQYVLGIEGAEEIRGSVFMFCSALKEITLGENLKIMGGDVFTGCSSLKYLELPDSLEQLSADFKRMGDDFYLLVTAGSLAEQRINEWIAGRYEAEEAYWPLNYKVKE